MIKRLYLSAVLVAIVCLLMGGATYAIFTSSDTNSGNNFTSGTIILTQERDMSDSVPGPMFYSAASDPSGRFPYDISTDPRVEPPAGECVGGWAPGDTVTRAMNLYNDGSLTAIVTKIKADVTSSYINNNDQVITGEVEGQAYEDFIDNMNVRVLYPSQVAQRQTLYNGSLRGLLNGWTPVQNAFLVFPRGDNTGPANITFEATLSTDAPNSLQGKNFIFDFSLLAEQYKNN